MPVTRKYVAFTYNILLYPRIGKRNVGGEFRNDASPDHGVR